MVKVGEILTLSKVPVTIDPLATYKQVTVRLFHNGLVLREDKKGQEIKSNQWLIRKNQFVISRIDARNGAMGIVPPELDKAVVTNDFLRYNIDKDRLDVKFFDFLTSTQSFVHLCDRASEGTTNRKRLRPDLFLNLDIPLPSLEEQLRTIATLNVLIAKIEETRKERMKAIAGCEKIVRAYSNHFFDPNSHYPKFSLGQVAEIRSGVTLGRELKGKTIHLPYLRVANVQDGHLNLQKMKNVEILESEKDKWKLLPGDILLTEGGDWDKLGRGTVWNDEIPDCIHQNHIFRLRFNLVEFLPKYVSSFIGSDYSKSYFQLASKQTTNLASINQKQLKNLKIPKPTLTEQHCIVTLLNHMQAKIDEVKRLQKETEREMEALVPAVLAKAFGG